MTDQQLAHVEQQLEELQRRESPFQKYILQIVTLVFVAGGGWMSLQHVSAQAEDNKEKVEETQETVQDIEKKLIRIETKQENIAKQVDEVQEKLDAILKAVQEAHKED